MKILLILFTVLLFTACTIEIDGPDGVPTEEDYPEIPATETEWVCFMPFEKDREWKYSVTFHQSINAEENHCIEYNGTETWTCTKVNWLDSIFVLGCSFIGERRIANAGEVTSENVLTQSGWVHVQIQNKKLCLLQEGGDTLYPFAGELISVLQDHFQIVFPDQNHDIQTGKYSQGTLLFDFQLDKNFGITLASFQDLTSNIILSFKLILSY